MTGLGSMCRGAAAVVMCSCLSISCSGASSESASSSAPAAPPATAPASTAASTHVVSGKGPAAVNGLPSVVVLAPKTAREFPAPAEKPYMDQVTMTFTPPVLFVRTGHPTEFRNNDDVLHNVRVREVATKEGVFNVAIITGGNYLHTFEREGFYDVGCDIHPGMSAQIIASASPYATQADAEGNFYFEDVEPGSYSVTIYSGTDKIERAIEVTGPKTEVGL